MGEIADDMIDGWSCSKCGQYFTESHGYPVLCRECWRKIDELPRSVYKLLHEADDED